MWSEAVAPLRKGATVLDLATGDGAVLVKMRAVRPDLKLIGVDSSPMLPKAPAGVSLRSGVPMERLPFPDRRLDLVSSQFGIEYGNVPEAALEVARVLRPGGAFTFLIHHAGGPIVAHNRARSAALAWACGEPGPLDRARSFVRARVVGALPVPAYFGEAVVEGRRLFPDQSVAAQFAEAVRRTLILSHGEPPQRTLAVLDELAAKASNELARVASLNAAARDERGIAAISTALHHAGLQPADPTTVADRAGVPPFAWLLRGRS